MQDRDKIDMIAISMAFTIGFLILFLLAWFAV